MKSVIVVCVLGLVALALARPEEEHYTDKYDNINLDEILDNKKLLTPYVKCLLDQGKCTAEGKELKSHMVEALQNDCAKCTKAQRDGTFKVIKHLINHEPEYWNQLKAKYDPKDEYSKKHEAELKAAKEKN